MSSLSPRSKVGMGHPRQPQVSPRMIHLDTLFDIPQIHAHSNPMPSSSVPSSPHTPDTPESVIARSCSGASIPFFYDRPSRDNRGRVNGSASQSGSPLGRDSNRPWSRNSNESSSTSSPSFEAGSSSTGSTDSTLFSSDENYCRELNLCDDDDDQDITIHGYTNGDAVQLSSVERIKYSAPKMSPTRMLVDPTSSKTIHEGRSTEDPFVGGLFASDYSVRLRPSTGCSGKDKELPMDPSLKGLSPRELPSIPSPVKNPVPSHSLRLESVPKSLPYLPSRHSAPVYATPSPPSRSRPSQSKRLPSMPQAAPIQPAYSHSSRLYSNLPSTTSLTVDGSTFAPPESISLQIDQEGFRTILPSFVLSPRDEPHSTDRHGSDILEYKVVVSPSDPNKYGYPFHLGYERMPVLRRLCVGEDRGRDYLKKMAKLGVGTDGIWRAIGGDGGESFCFVYEVADRLSLNDKVLAGEKLLRPILFLCSKNFFDPSRGRKIGLMQIAKKALTTPSTSTLVKPVLVPQDRADDIEAVIDIIDSRAGDQDTGRWMGVAL